MATMFPNAVELFHTPGEERVYRWLAAVAKPDDAHLAWYTPDIGDLEPDFVLYSPDVGLVVLEVKDWTLEHIFYVDPDTVELWTGGRSERRDNPLRQARNYRDRLKDALRHDRRLMAKDPVHHGNPKIPLHHGVVFPNICRHEWEGQPWTTVIPADRVFFADDLHPDGAICCDPSGGAFRAALQERFPPRFAFSLTEREVHFLRGLLFPQVRVDLPTRSGGRVAAGGATGHDAMVTADALAYEADRERLRVLDGNQEAIARRWDGGHHLIVGPPGSGKTLVLVHKAAFLLRYDPRVKHILLLCYNITLVNYIRRLLGAKGVPLGEGGVDVVHLYELCARVLGEPVPFEGEDADFYDLAVQEAADRALACGLRYDAVLIHEGQDFSDDMIRLATGLLNPVTNHLWVALDQAQDIYLRSGSWKKVGMKARSRVHRLRADYRSTQEISAFAARLAGSPSGPASAASAPATANLGARVSPPTQLELLPDLLAVHGPEPAVRRFADLAAAVASIPGTILELQRDYGYPLSEFAVLYPMRSVGNGVEGDGVEGAGANLPAAIQTTLDAQGIVWRWASEDMHSKRSYDITADSVTISTVHSVKGLDFSCVFLVGFDMLKPGGRWSEAQIRSLTYVAATRARVWLWVLEGPPPVKGRQPAGAAS
ncbi:MAG: NERD domain-containing protein [Thermoleophilia bacterium]|nr:NERD domain-containing protein [Thermoleophilia bacterium]